MRWKRNDFAEVLSELLLAQDQTADTIAEVEENLKRIGQAQQEMFEKIAAAVDKLIQKLPE